MRVCFFPIFVISCTFYPLHLSRISMHAFMYIIIIYITAETDIHVALASFVNKYNLCVCGSVVESSLCVYIRPPLLALQVSVVVFIASTAHTHHLCMDIHF